MTATPGFLSWLFGRRRRRNDRVSPDAEAMKYQVQKYSREISQVSHANTNAVMHMQGSSAEMRKSADALAQLARGFQGRL